MAVERDIAVGWTRLRRLLALSYICLPHRHFQPQGWGRRVLISQLVGRGVSWPSPFLCLPRRDALAQGLMTVELDIAVGWMRRLLALSMCLSAAQALSATGTDDGGS